MPAAVTVVCSKLLGVDGPYSVLTVSSDLSSEHWASLLILVADGDWMAERHGRFGVELNVP